MAAAGHVKLKEGAYQHGTPIGMILD